MHYFDLIASNDSKQDQVAVISIVDPLFYRLRKWLAQLKERLMSSDNATCYSNDILGVICHIVGEIHGLNVHGYVYLNAQCSNGPVDSHFAVLKRWVEKYVKGKGEDVSCATDLITALSYKGGLPNTTILLFNIYRNRVGIKEIKAAQRTRKFAPPWKMCRVTFYQASAKETLCVYRYSGGDAYRFAMGKYFMDSERIRDLLTKVISLHGRPNEKVDILEHVSSSMTINLTLDHTPRGHKDMGWRMVHRTIKRTGRKIAVRKTTAMKNTYMGRLFTTIQEAGIELGAQRVGW